jgi:hypothetical protein
MLMTILQAHMAEGVPDRNRRSVVLKVILEIRRFFKQVILRLSKIMATRA